jgi:hypothetical protein
MFEWISYDQFDDIQEIGKGGFSIVYSATWKDGLLYGSSDYYQGPKSWKRKSNTRVVLKCLDGSQKFINEFIDKV